MRKPCFINSLEDNKYDYQLARVTNLSYKNDADKYPRDQSQHENANEEKEEDNGMGRGGTGGKGRRRMK